MMQLRPEEFIVLVLKRGLHGLLVQVVRTRVIAEQEVVRLVVASSDVPEDQLVLIVGLH